MESILADRHEEALRVWRCWKKAKRRRERDAALFTLWQLCEVEIWAAARKLADRLGEGWGEHVTVSAWRLRHSMDEDDVRYTAFPAVAETAKRFEPRRGAAFQTLAYSHILRELYRATKVKSISDSLPLLEEHTERVYEEELLPGPSVWTIFDLDDTAKRGGSERGKKLRECSSSELDSLAVWLRENKDVAVEHYGEAEWTLLHATVSTIAWLSSMPPHEKIVDDGPGLIGIKAAAFPPHGEKIDIAKPFEAAHLRRQGYSLREIAGRLGVGKNKVAEMLKRYEAHGGEKFTLAEMVEVAAGSRRRRPRKNS